MNTRPNPITRVDEREQHEVGERGHERAHDLAAEDERDERRQDHEQRQLDAADAVGQRGEAPAAQDVGEPEAGDEEGEPAEPRGEVGPQRPVEVDRARAARPTNTSASNGTARVKTSSLALQPSIRFGSPAWRKRRS